MISEEEFKDLAKLARLDPEEGGLSELRNDFNKILDFVNQIQELQGDVTEDFLSPNQTVNVTRPDTGEETLGTAAIAAFAPAWEAGHFVVPGVLDQEH